MEYKEVPLTRLKAKAEGFISGHGAIFGNKDLQGDIIEQGAFAASLEKRGGKVKMFYQHSEPIGMFTAREDDKGLHVEGHALIDDVKQAREAHALVRANVIDGLSIGYRVEKNGSAFDDDGTRRLSKLDVLEVSLVVFPANERARIHTAKQLPHALRDDARSLTIRKLERLLRDAGFSLKEAKAIAAAGFAGLTNLRAEDDPEAVAALRALVAKLQPN